MCPHNTLYVSSYYSICVLILLYVSAYYSVSSYYFIWLLILHTTIGGLHQRGTALYLRDILPHTPVYRHYDARRQAQHEAGCHTAMYVSSYCYVCVLMLLYMWPHTAVHVSSCCYVCGLILLCVSSCCYKCGLILLYMCPYAAIYV